MEESKTSRWSLVLDADQTVCAVRDLLERQCPSRPRDRMAELGRIASNDFGGRVVRNMITSLYIARRARRTGLPQALRR